MSFALFVFIHFVVLFCSLVYMITTSLASVYFLASASQELFFFFKQRTAYDI